MTRIPPDLRRADFRRNCLRHARRWLLVCACAGFGGCSWLEGEFSTLDRLPASARPAAPDAPGPAVAERP
jgi:hypothetical protein